MPKTGKRALVMGLVALLMSAAAGRGADLVRVGSCTAIEVQADMARALRNGSV